MKVHICLQKSLSGDFANVEAGDCIIAFSRKDIFDVKVCYHHFLS